MCVCVLCVCVNMFVALLVACLSRAESGRPPNSIKIVNKVRLMITRSNALLKKLSCDISSEETLFHKMCLRLVEEKNGFFSPLFSRPRTNQAVSINYNYFLTNKKRSSQINTSCTTKWWQRFNHYLFQVIVVKI